MTSGRNVNVAGGPTETDARGVPVMGDPYLQRQNEPSMACSSRNPLNCLAGANDYRRLNFPGVQDGKVTGDAWLGQFWTRDGGNTWRSALLPGYLEDLDPLGQASPAHPFEATADPIVRAGTNGLFFYSGIAFDRGAIAEKSAGGEGKDGVMFVARFIDDNNTQTLDTPFRYLGASPVAFSNSARFLDKPGMAVDIPRSGSATCTIPARADIPAQSFPGGNVYVAYAAFMGDDDPHTKITFHRSTDCGETWSGQVMLSESSRINQSPTIAIEPSTGRVYVAWREFAADKNGDQIMVAVSNDLGKTFAKGVVAGILRQADGTSAGFDQPTLPTVDVNGFRLFRTNTYPTMCVAGNGTAYVAWAHRGLGPLGEARIVYTTSADGTTWTTPAPVEPLVNGSAFNGHQFMPAAACGGDKVTLIWYDQRDDAIAVPEMDEASVFAPLLLDTRDLTIPTRTLDVRAAIATAGHPFQPSVPVTRYPLGVYMAGEGPATLQLQFSLENLPLFGGGVVPFIGDYIDVAAATVFQPITTGSGQTGTSATGATFSNRRRGSRPVANEPNGWVFNSTPEGTPTFHAVWSDNRDVVAGTEGAPIDMTNPPCTPGTQAGSKNQNIYTARLSTGLVAGVLGNARPLGDELRAFSVFVQNLTPHPKRVELRIANQPVGGGTASFIQFAPEPSDIRFPFPLTGLTEDFAPTIAAFSTIARTVFVSGSGSSAIRVDVDEIITAGGTTTVGQQLFAMINPDPTNPAPVDPALRDFFSETHESFIGLSSITDYDLLNPNFLNPTFLNPTFLNPNFLNPNFLNPNFLNPTFLNPTFLNPTFLNPTFLNTTMTEITWDVSAAGNTSSSYLLALLSSMEFPPSWTSQLLIYRTYLSPWGNGFDPATGAYDCGLGTSEQHDLLLDVLNPNFLNPTFLNIDFSNPNFLNTALGAETGNATFSLSSADSAKVVLRVAHDGTFQPSFVTAVTIPQAVDTLDASTGVTVPSTPPPPLAFAVGPTMPVATEGVPYTAALAVTGGTAPHTWTYVPPSPCPGCDIVLFEGLPPGLTFTNGVVSGTPTSLGTWTFTVQVSDSTPTPQTITGLFTITIDPTLAVTNTNDNGPGSLRQAIVDANGAPGADEIRFNIPGAGPHTISLSTPLPAVTDPVFIDGASQPGFAGAPVVQVNGSAAGAGASGLALTGGPSRVRGLSIAGFGGSGIAISGAGGHVVDGNYVGLLPDGVTAAGNGAGVAISSSLGNAIGGATAQARNVIAGNTGPGIRILGGVDFGGNRIEGNYIGTTATGGAALANGGAGIELQAPTIVGGATAGLGNVISGNGLSGISLSGDDHESTIQGNVIGLNAAGAAAIPNGGDGISIGDTEFSLIGGTAAGAGNVISGNTGAGIRLSGDASATTIHGNVIGLNAAGTAAVGNGGNGVDITATFGTDLGGTAAGARNVISGNGGHGVSIQSQSRNNVVEGNYIGTDVTGTLDLGNAGIGVHLSDEADDNRIGGPTAAARNVISGNNEHGLVIELQSVNNTVEMNYIGTNAAGTVMISNGAPGGPPAFDWEGDGVVLRSAANIVRANVIGGNKNNVTVSGAAASGNTIAGNVIGLTADGTAKLTTTRSFFGILVSNAPGTIIGGLTAADRNVVSGHFVDGIWIGSDAATSTVVQGNYVGTDGTGTSPLSNTQAGIRVRLAASATIGGAAAGAGNVNGGNGGAGISLESSGSTIGGNRIGVGPGDELTVGNGGAGIVLASAPAGTGNAILENVISGNGGLGIDLGGDGVTANDAGDADAGHNNLQNFPVLTAAVSGAGSLDVQGTLSSTPGMAFTIRLFGDTTCDASGNGEGRYFLGSVTVLANVTGDALINMTVPAGQAVPGTVVTVTATDTFNNTSEFSACRAVISPPPAPAPDSVEGVR